jgi:hypothetical protein
VFGKGKREREHLERNGRRAPATVVEIARFGMNIGDAGPDRASSGSEAVRMTTLRVQPEGEPEFGVKRRLRYGDGKPVPKAGDRIDVLYDPDDHEKVMVAPPTAEEEQIRVAAALSQAKIGLTIGGGGDASAQVAKAECAIPEGADAADAGSIAKAAQLQHLEAMKASGALSEEQYEAAKKALGGD